jgi:hypothetical protein
MNINNQNAIHCSSSEQPATLLKKAIHAAAVDGSKCHTSTYFVGKSTGKSTLRLIV